MSFVSDVFSFEHNKLGNMWDKYKKNPERLFLGINTPLESNVWGKVTGTHYTPTVDMFGGATKDDVSTANAEGIDTGPGESMHNLARAMTSVIAGGYGASALGGGAAGASGAGLEAGSSAGAGIGGGEALGSGLSLSPGEGIGGSFAGADSLGSGISGGGIAGGSAGSGSVAAGGAGSSPSWMQLASKGMNMLGGMQGGQHPQPPTQFGPLYDNNSWVTNQTADTDRMLLAELLSRRAQNG